MSTSAETEGSSQDGSLIRPATDAPQTACGPAFLTEVAVVRLREGLRAQREQQAALSFSEGQSVARRFESSDSWQDWLNVVTDIEPISENPPLAPDADEPAFPIEKDTSSLSSRRKIGSLLWAILLLVSAAVLGVVLSARTVGLDDQTLVNAEARGHETSVPLAKPEPPAPISNDLKSSVPTIPAPPSLALPNEDPAEPPDAAMPAKEIEAPAPSPQPSVEAHGPATAATEALAPPTKQTDKALTHAAPGASERFHRHHANNHWSMRKRPLARRAARHPSHHSP